MIIFISIVVGALAIAIATVPVLVGMHLHHHDSHTVTAPPVNRTRDTLVTVERPSAASLTRQILIEQENRRRARLVSTSV